MIKRKWGQNLKSVVLQEKRMSREWVEKWPWRYEHCEAHWVSTIYCIYFLYHSFYTSSWESLQNVNLKTLECTYSGKMGSGFQIIRVQFIHVLLFVSHLFPQLRLITDTRNWRSLHFSLWMKHPLLLNYNQPGMFRDYLNHLKHGPFSSQLMSPFFFYSIVCSIEFGSELNQTTSTYIMLVLSSSAFRVMVLLVLKDTEF